MLKAAYLNSIFAFANVFIDLLKNCFMTECKRLGNINFYTWEILNVLIKILYILQTKKIKNIHHHLPIYIHTYIY